VVRIRSAALITGIAPLPVPGIAVVADVRSTGLNTPRPPRCWSAYCSGQGSFFPARCTTEIDPVIALPTE
jgi:hypothetical protein